jgi:hypothetical protein
MIRPSDCDEGDDRKTTSEYQCIKPYAQWHLVWLLDPTIVYQEQGYFKTIPMPSEDLDFA